MSRYLPLVFILSGSLILGMRYYKARQCHDLCIHGSDLVLNNSAFRKEVVAQHPRMVETPIHLVVFLDPLNDCPACLFEFPEWIRPLTAFDYFGVTLLVPEATPSEQIDALMRDYGLAKGTFQVFAPTSPMADYHRFGVLKVLYSGIENEVLWYESGSKNERAYQSFADKLSRSLQEHQDQSL